jgi:threonine dehydrogenase-like Zn-dependent dehydrogenase
MKAVLWEGKPYHMTVKDVPRPVIRSPTDVIVRVTTAAICGTDLHTYHGLFGGSDVPYSVGHEAMGIISEVGPEVQVYKVGDRVVVPDGVFTMNGRQLEVVAHGYGNLFGNDAGGCQGECVLLERYLGVMLTSRSGICPSP